MVRFVHVFSSHLNFKINISMKKFFNEDDKGKTIWTH